MQHLPWNDLRILLAVARAQSLSGAANLLGVNATTISRRLKLLEDFSGSPIVLRDPNGNLCLTQTGQALADHSEGMERHANLADTLLGRDMVLGGTVRLTAVPFLLNRFVSPNIHHFTGTNPALQISHIPDNRNLSLTRREVDLAIRLGGQTKVVTPCQRAWIASKKMHFVPVLALRIGRGSLQITPLQQDTRHEKQTAFDHS